MIIKYTELPDLPDKIKDGIVAGGAVLYYQKNPCDDKGTKYIMVISNLYFRLNETGGLILPPLESMPDGADDTDVVILRKD